MNARYSELAFEEFIGHAPPELWRVVCLRHRRPGEEPDVRDVQWYDSEAAALAHVEYIQDGRGVLVRVDKYSRVGKIA